MRSITLAEVNAKLAAQERKSALNGTAVVVPIHLMPAGTRLVLRPLPSADETQPINWVEEHLIYLPFAGITNSDRDTLETVTAGVPAMTMFGGKDPILEAHRHQWRTEDEAIARTYYRQLRYIIPCVVISAPFVEKEEPASPVRVVKIKKQLMDVYRLGLTDPEIVYAPYDVEHGRNLVVVKTMQGPWPNYSTSHWAHKESAVDEATRRAIEQHGLIDPVSLLPPKPDAALQAVIAEMHAASLAGEPFDNAKWGNHFRAYPPFASTANGNGGNGRTTAAAPLVKASPDDPTLKALRARIASKTVTVD